MSNFLLWAEGKKIVAARVQDLTDTLKLGDEDIDVLDMYFSDYDVLLNQNNQLVGVAFFTDGKEPLLTAPLITQSTNVKWDGNQMLILLGESGDFSIETVQGMGVRIYQRSNKDYALGIPDCDFDQIGFTLINCNTLGAGASEHGLHSTPPA
jgi:hypothetical protein